MVFRPGIELGAPAPEERDRAVPVAQDRPLHELLVLPDGRVLEQVADLLAVLLERAREPLSEEELTVALKEPRETTRELLEELRREGVAVSPKKSGKWLAAVRLAPGIR